MKPHSLLAAPLAVPGPVAALPSPAFAGEGHEHGDAPAAPTGPALPRFAAVSETFELVGVLDGRQITLYLDRTEDNSPVHEARIELEIGGAKHTAEAHGEAVYEVLLKEAPQPGVLPITAVITAGKSTDPAGLCSVFKMMSRVRGVTARRTASQSIA